MPFVTKGKTNLKYLLIVVGLAIIVGGGIFGYHYLGIKNLGKKLAVPEVKLPEKIKDETVSWKIYRSEKYIFEFKYPKNWVVQEISPDGSELRDEKNRLMISITSVNRTISGITYCEAYPQDTPRCENITVNNIPVTIDWEANSTANALFAVTDKFGLSVTLHQVSTETKMIFRQILSTFRFLE